MNSSKTASLSTRVVEKIAERTRTDPTHLPTPLAEVVNPDALDNLFADRDPDGQVTFTYEGFTVTARSDGTVNVRD